MATKFDYPEQGWSTGNMRMARKAPIGDPGYPIRELESERKRRETKVSMLDKLPVEPTPQEQHRARGTLDYDILKQRIGKQGADWIMEWDNMAKGKDAGQEFIDHWNENRQFWIRMFEERKGKSMPMPGTPPPHQPGYSAPVEEQV